MLEGKYKADLHSHTLSWGGTNTPVENIRKACPNLRAVATTQYMSLNHRDFQAASNEAAKYSSIVVPSVELPSDKGHFQIIGRDDYTDAQLEKFGKDMSFLPIPERIVDTLVKKADYWGAIIGIPHIGVHGIINRFVKGFSLADAEGFLRKYSYTDKGTKRAIALERYSHETDILTYFMSLFYKKVLLEDRLNQIDKMVDSLKKDNIPVSLVGGSDNHGNNTGESSFFWEGEDNFDGLYKSIAKGETTPQTKIGHLTTKQVITEGAKIMVNHGFPRFYDKLLKLARLEGKLPTPLQATYRYLIMTGQVSMEGRQWLELISGEHKKNELKPVLG